MRIHPAVVFSLSLAALAAAFPARTRATPIHGLTVAVSPNGQALIAAGSTRTFYRLDPETLDVLDRVWNGLSITRMAFSRDGTVLAVADAGMGGTISLFDAATLQLRTEVKPCARVAFSTPADLFAGIAGHRGQDAKLRVYSLADGTPRMEVPLLPRRGVAAVALDPDGRLAAVLYDGQADPAEERVAVDAGLRGLDRAIAQQRGDGRTSVVEFYEIPDGRLLARHTLFYSPAGAAQAVLLDGALIAVNYQNQNAVIGQDGAVHIFLSETSHNYGIGFSSDHRMAVTGGLASLALITLPDTASREMPVQDRLPSWPEYFRGFAGRAEGPLYGASDGYRVFIIDRDGSVRLARPVF